jgi:hypothetical protein
VRSMSGASGIPGDPPATLYDLARFTNVSGELC